MLFKKKMSSPIGKLTLIASDKAITGVHFGDYRGAGKLKIEESKNHPVLRQCESELTAYFEGRLSHFSVPLSFEGTQFQQRVWSSLKKIPYGKTISYSQQAQSIGRKSAVRAVAAANGKNPIAIILPCHRVVASTGHLHGFGGGLTLKQKLLKIEGVNVRNLKVTIVRKP